MTKLTPTVAVIVGSLRQNSVNRAFADALSKLAAPKLNLRLVEIGDLPLYSEDLEADLPAPVVRFKQEIESADAVLLVTPEYLRSIPGVLKNALDWGARPWGKNSWGGKPGAIVGASIGQIGTAAAQAHLRSIASVLDIHLIAQPEIYLHFKPGLIDASGDIMDESLRGLLQNWVDRFADWIARLEQKPALAR